MILTILLILISSSYLYAVDNDIHHLKSEQTFEYARTLFMEKDYYRSITEFKRYLFFSENKLKKSKAELYIGLNYLGGKDYQNAKRVFQNINDDIFHSQRKIAALKLADTNLTKKKSKIKQHKYYDFFPLYFSTEYYVNYLEEYKNNDQYYDEAYTKLILVNMLNINRDKTVSLINNATTTNNKYKALLEKMTVNAEKMYHIPQKSKLTAILLSIIPGMGQVYAGEVKKGFIALAVNVVMGFTAYYSFVHYDKFLGIFIGQFELTFYSGNIINAQNAVAKYNENQKNLFRQELFKLYF